MVLVQILLHRLLYGTPALGILIGICLISIGPRLIGQTIHIYLMFQTYVQEQLWALLPQVTVRSLEIQNQLRTLANSLDIYTALTVIQADSVKQELEAVQTSINKGYKKVHEAVRATNTVF